jgi:predicted nuclease of restriction endonuclease-like (RecB) superfamily
MLSDDDERSFYEKECINSGWSVRELKRQISSSLFQRLILSKSEANKQTVKELAQQGQSIQSPADLIKEPYVFEFLGIQEQKPILEKDLEKTLIRNIENFLLELGRGFMFVGSQQRVTLNNIHNYIDLVFYNKALKAYVLIDLKIRKFKAEDVGQMNAYLNYYKTEVNEPTDDEPIGIILCANKDEIAAEYALGGLANNIFATKYIYYLPEKEQLIQQVERVLMASKADNQHG